MRMPWSGRDYIPRVSRDFTAIFLQATDSVTYTLHGAQKNGELDTGSFTACAEKDRMFWH
jgi:hypothetical protein